MQQSHINNRIHVEILISLCRKSGTDIWIKQFNAVHPFKQYSQMPKNITFDIYYYFSQFRVNIPTLTISQRLLNFRAFICYYYNPSKVVINNFFVTGWFDRFLHNTNKPLNLHVNLFGNQMRVKRIYKSTCNIKREIEKPGPDSEPIIKFQSESSFLSEHEIGHKISSDRLLNQNHVGPPDFFSLVT